MSEWDAGKLSGREKLKSHIRILGSGEKENKEMADVREKCIEKGAKRNGKILEISV